MDFFDVLFTRKTVRKYTTDVPPIEDVKKIIDAARVAPSATNSQMWHFTAVLNKDIKEKMRQAVIEKFDEMNQWPESEPYKNKLQFYKQYATFFADAPVVIAVFKTPRDSFINELLERRGFTYNEINRQRPDGSLLSIGAAVENLSLTAHAMGYGTCWMAAPLYAYEQLESILGTSSDKQLVSLVSLGVPNESKGLTPKKSLDDVLDIIE